jgi:hypothetical protein
MLPSGVVLEIEGDRIVGASVEAGDIETSHHIRHHQGGPRVLSPRELGRDDPLAKVLAPVFIGQFHLSQLPETLT